MEKLFNKLVSLISFAILFFFGPLFINTSLSKAFILGVPTSFVLLFAGWLLFIMIVAYIIQKSSW